MKDVAAAKKFAGSLETIGRRIVQHFTESLWRVLACYAEVHGNLPPVKTGAKNSPRQSQNNYYFCSTPSTPKVRKRSVYLPFTLSDHALMSALALSDASLFG